jgi:carboxyl-terminal processing protease
MQASSRPAEPALHSRRQPRGLESFPMIRRPLAACVLAAAFLVSPARAEQKLEPTDAQRAALRLTYGILSDAHYALHARVPDDELSAQIFDRYLDALDYQRVLFTEADLRGFAALRKGLDDAIRKGDPAPAFTLFAASGERLERHAEFARRELAAPLAPMPGATWRMDRSEATRPADAAARETLWRQWLVHEVLELTMAGLDEAEARATVGARPEGARADQRHLAPSGVFEGVVKS